MVKKFKCWLVVREFKRRFNDFVVLGYHLNSRKLSILTTQLEKDINNITSSNFNSEGKIKRVEGYLNSRLSLTNDNEVYDLLYSLLMMLTLVEYKYGVVQFED